MAAKDPKVDAYIANAAEFARPILNHLRRLVHRACPEVEESMKWSHPHFGYKGMMCGIASFKTHCGFGFWKGDMIFKNVGGKPAVAAEAMGHFGRITALSDLPDDKEILAYITEAVRLNEEGIEKPPRPRPSGPRELVVPDYFLATLKKNKKAHAVFEQFSYSHRKEYVEWIVEAKTEETRNRRMATAIEWLSQGKSRNWKYMNC
jgi:hypothetical protein